MKKLIVAFVSFFILHVASAQTQPAHYDKIPVSHSDLGEFPYFTFPSAFKAMNTPYQNEDDHLFIPINGKFKEFTGKVWRSYVESTSGDWSEFSFNKNLSNWITSKGGVLIYKGKVSLAQINLVKDKMDYAGSEGSIDYWNEPVSVYLIKQGSKNVYIQFYCSSASGAIQIIESNDAF